MFFEKTGNMLMTMLRRRILTKPSETHEEKCPEAVMDPEKTMINEGSESFQVQWW